MNDLLRTLRLGIIDLLGVTVPGLMLLFLLIFGCIAPSLLFIGDVVCPKPAVTRQPVIAHTDAVPPVMESGESRLVSTLRNLPPFGRIPTTFIVAIILILAYIIGYILRLSTPDKLDQRSTEIVLNEMEKAKPGSVKTDKWPQRLNEGENKFPYFHFAEYLKHRQHRDLAKHVKWNSRMRSKTCVNMMKLETSLRCPQLSAIIESNEAHIRLLFGTWSACRVSRVFTVAGIIVSVLGLAVSVLWPDLWPYDRSPQLSYVVWVFITLLLLLGTTTAKRQIERLFHYRRVRELFDVVACYHLACEGFDAAGRPKDGPYKVADQNSVVS